MTFAAEVHRVISGYRAQHRKMPKRILFGHEAAAIAKAALETLCTHPSDEVLPYGVIGVFCGVELAESRWVPVDAMVLEPPVEWFKSEAFVPSGEFAGRRVR